MRLSFNQDAKSAAIMESFKKMVPQTASVIRGGKITEVEAEKLTIGDLIEVKGGDKLPADIRIVSCSSFKVFIYLFSVLRTLPTIKIYIKSVNLFEMEMLEFY